MYRYELYQVCSQVLKYGNELLSLCLIIERYKYDIASWLGLYDLEVTDPESI